MADDGSFHIVNPVKSPVPSSIFPSGQSVLYGALIGGGIPLAVKGVKSLFGFGKNKTKEEEEKEKRKSTLRRVFDALSPALGGAALGALAGNYISNSIAVEKLNRRYADLKSNAWEASQYYPVTARSSGLTDVMEKYERPDPRYSLDVLAPRGALSFLGRLFTPYPLTGVVTAVRNKMLTDEYNAAANTLNKVYNEYTDMFKGRASYLQHAPWAKYLHSVGIDFAGNHAKLNTANLVKNMLAPKFRALKEKVYQEWKLKDSMPHFRAPLLPGVKYKQPKRETR